MLSNAQLAAGTCRQHVNIVASLDQQEAILQQQQQQPCGSVRSNARGTHHLAHALTQVSSVYSDQYANIRTSRKINTVSRQPVLKREYANKWDKICHSDQIFFAVRKEYLTVFRDRLATPWSADGVCHRSIALAESTVCEAHRPFVHRCTAAAHAQDWNTNWIQSCVIDKPGEAVSIGRLSGRSREVTNWP